MIEGVFGSSLNFQAFKTENQSGRSNATGLDFKNTMIDLARTASMAVTGKNTKEEISFNKWRDLEETLWFNPQEEEEEAAEQHLKKLKRILQEHLCK